MAFRIQDLSIHVASKTENDDHAKNEGPPCTMMSGEPEKCHGISIPDRPCRGKGSEKPKQDPPGSPGDRKGLAFLRAQLRETLAPPPL